MATKATLFDLYKMGKELTITEGDVSVTVYLQKMNAIQQQKAQRKANGARAGVLAMQRDENSEQRAEYETGFVDQFPTRSDRVQFLVADKNVNERSKAEARLAESDKWAKDDYLEGLQEAWEDEMKDLWTSEDTRTEESDRVYKELKAYIGEVDEAVKPAHDKAVKEFEAKTDDELHRLVVDRQLRAESDMAWLNEYRMQEIFFTVRDKDNTNKFYFGSRQELDMLPNLIQQKLLSAIQQLTVDVAEGKGLPETPDS